MSENRSGHPFWIYETIMRCGDVLASWREEKQQLKLEQLANTITEKQPKHIFLAGTGSSYLAAIAQSFGFNQLAGIPSSSWVTGELRSYPPPHFAKNALLILNTHSGKSPGDVKLVEQAKRHGIYTIGITDVCDSPFARDCDDLLIGQDGPKRELPSTRTYSSAIFRTLLLAVTCAEKSGSGRAIEGYRRALNQLPERMKEFLIRFDAKAKSLAATFDDRLAYVVVSSGPNMATAYEGAMGLTQGTGKPAAGYNVDEYLHGPIQSLGSGHCVVAVAPPGPFQEKIITFARCARSIGARVILITPEGSAPLEEEDVVVPMPGSIPEVITPVLYCAPFWLLGYYLSLRNCLDPDNLSMTRNSFKASGLRQLKIMV
jgi:glucosamine 6-phosphate synthetase-like amidotransferase/phosphosugar isomerase protein